MAIHAHPLVIYHKAVSLSLEIIKKVGVGLGEITIKAKFIREVYIPKVGASNSFEAQLKHIQQSATDEAVKDGIGKLLAYIQQSATNEAVKEVPDWAVQCLTDRCARATASINTSKKLYNVGQGKLT